MHTLWGLLASSYQLQGGGASHCCSLLLIVAQARTLRSFGGGGGDHVNRKLFLRVGTGTGRHRRAYVPPEIQIQEEGPRIQIRVSALQVCQMPKLSVE